MHVDFGAQYAQLIARRVREAHVFSRIVPHHITAEQIKQESPVAIILSGGPKTVHVDGAPTIDAAIYDLGIPILGICYGSQLIAQQLGGTVARSGRGEYGKAKLTTHGSSVLLPDEVADGDDVWMSHFDSITQPPTGFAICVSTPDAPVALMENVDRKIFGVQYHPEVMHTPHGQELLINFLHHIAGCRADWTMTNLIQESIETIRLQVGNGRAICGLSGGVDSSVVAQLLNKAIGKTHH